MFHGGDRSSVTAHINNTCLWGVPVRDELWKWISADLFPSHRILIQPWGGFLNSDVLISLGEMVYPGRFFSFYINPTSAAGQQYPRYYMLEIWKPHDIIIKSSTWPWCPVTPCHFDHSTRRGRKKLRHALRTSLEIPPPTPLTHNASVWIIHTDGQPKED